MLQHRWIDGWMVSFTLTPRIWQYAGYHYDVKKLGYAITPGDSVSQGDMIIDSYYCSGVGTRTQCPQG
jgi:hypothetical protein